MNNQLKELELLRGIAEAVMALEFGASPALPWCIDSFPKLHQAISSFEEFEKSRIKEDNV